MMFVISDPILIEFLLNGCFIWFFLIYDYVVPPLAVNLIKGHTSIDKWTNEWLSIRLVSWWTNL